MEGYRGGGGEWGKENGVLISVGMEFELSAKEVDFFLNL